MKEVILTLANRPGFILGFALAALLGAFSLGLAIGSGEYSMVLIDIGVIAFCVLMFILGVKEACKRRHKPSETKS